MRRRDCVDRVIGWLAGCTSTDDGAAKSKADCLSVCMYVYLTSEPGSYSSIPISDKMARYVFTSSPHYSCQSVEYLRKTTNHTRQAARDHPPTHSFSLKTGS